MNLSVTLQRGGGLVDAICASLCLTLNQITARPTQACPTGTNNNLWDVHSRCAQASLKMWSMLSEIWGLLRARKKFWLLPIIIVMLVLGALLVFAQTSALAPFIYTIF